MKALRAHGRNLAGAVVDILADVRDFTSAVLYEARRSVPRTWYFIRTGRLHPEVRR